PHLSRFHGRPELGRNGGRSKDELHLRELKRRAGNRMDSEESEVSAGNGPREGVSIHTRGWSGVQRIGERCVGTDDRKLAVQQATMGTARGDQRGNGRYRLASAAGC